MFATWTTPDGEEFVLTDTNLGWFTTPGPAGWGAPQYELVTDPIARGGAHLRFVRAEPARINWPLYVWGDTHDEFVANWRTIRRAFLLSLHRGEPGVLRVSRPSGTGAREIEAFYEEGFSGEAGQNWVSAKPVVSLWCPDGYWRDVEDTSLPFTYGEGTSFFAPYPQVSASQVLGSTTVNNPGEVVAWPRWTVTGPMVALTAINDTTGQSFELTYTLAAGQTITIDTNSPQITGPSGENLVSALNWPAAYLWPLVTGDNEVQFNVSGAEAGTGVELVFRARYEGS